MAIVKTSFGQEENGISEDLGRDVAVSNGSPRLLPADRPVIQGHVRYGTVDDNIGFNLDLFGPINLKKGKYTEILHYDK